MLKSCYCILIMVICSIALAEDASDSVTFTTAEPAPSGFTSWTFYWSMPEVDPDATLEYVVFQPDGGEYYRMSIPPGTPAGSDIRSDFYEGFAGGNPEVLFDHNIQVTFNCDIGTIHFSDDASYQFEFIEVIEAVR